MKGVCAIQKPRTDMDLGYPHPAVNISIAMSVQGLPDDLRGLFEMLAVFEHNTMIPSEALSTIWGLDDLETQDHMEGIPLSF